MEEALPSLSSGAIGSRFVSQDDVDSAKNRRDEQWKQAYARLGQDPPKQVEEAYDGRSLAEKLAANRIAKQEEYEEKTKLANQFRALEEDEIMFLDSIREKEDAEEYARKVQDGEEVEKYKEAVAARSVAPPPVIASSSKPVPERPRPMPAPKKDVKKSLKGVVVKKKAKPAATTVPSTEKKRVASDPPISGKSDSEAESRVKRPKLSDV